MTVLGAVWRYLTRVRTRQITGLQAHDFIIIDSNGNASKPMAVEETKPGTYHLIYTAFPLNK